MTETKTAPVKRGGWLRKLAIIAAIFMVLLVVAWFVVTSGGFFKGVILPRVAAAMNSEVTVSDASISPFSRVVLKNLKVTPDGRETLLTADEIRFRYSLMAILGGNIKVDEVALVAPTVTLVQAADGSSNLDPITKGQTTSQPAEAEAPAPPGKPSERLQIDITRVALMDGTVRITKNYADGQRDLTEVTNLNITLENLKNGGSGKLVLAAAMKLDNNPPAPGTNASLQAKLDGNFTFELTDDLWPRQAKGDARLDVPTAGGALADAAGLAMTLSSELSPTEIKELAVRLQRSGANLGALTVAGPFDAMKQEGKLAVVLAGIDKQALNLAGGGAGLNFNDTTIGSTNQIELTQGGKLITVNGQMIAARFSATQQGQTTPVLDFNAAYDLTVDQTKSNALIRTFILNGVQSGRELLRGTLSRPMAVNWGGAGDAVDESALDLAINNLNLADWRAFAAEFAPAGSLNAKLNLLSQQGGQKLKLDLTAQLADFAAKFESNRIDGADMTLAMRADVDDLKKVSLTTLDARLNHQKQEALTLSSSGTVNAETQDTDLQAKIELKLPRLASLLGNPSLKISSGSVQFDGRITQQNKSPGQTNNSVFDRAVTGTLKLDNLTGQYAEYQFDRFEATADCDLAVKDQLAEIRKLNASLRQAGQPGGSLGVSGNWNLASSSGDIALKVTDLNQNTLRSFLASSLGEKKLASISINANAQAKVASSTDAALKTDLSVTNFVVNDPSGQIPNKPLDATAALDASLVEQVLDLRQCQLALAPTARAKNQMQLGGKVDMTKSNAITGALKLTAESIDVTPYYDLFMAESKTTTAKGGTTSGTSTGTGSGGVEKEPEPVTMPLKDFTVDLAIGKFYLREIEITNWLATLKLDPSRVVLDPFQLALNGAPVKAATDLDLSVPGYRYDISATADSIPIEPLANSFSPEYRGQAKGDLIANLKIKGAGTTGASLQKNLTGETLLTFTNANIRLAGKKMKAVVSVIALALRVPELTQSPITWLSANARMGGGKVDVTAADFVSPAFTANTAGEITLATVMTNSAFQDWPVNLSLNRSLAERANLVPANAPTNAPYVELPVFARVRGTLGVPETYIDKAKLAGMTLKSITGIPGIGDSKAGGVLQNLGGFLSGDKKTAPTNAPAGQTATNAPATNAPASPVKGLFDRLTRPK